MYKTRSTKGYRKSLKRVSRHRNFDIIELQTVIKKLCADEILPHTYKDHQLIGSMKEYRECHVQNDLLLVYQKQDNILILLLVDIGSHSEVFG
jgi:mRNA interferase YafQ